VPSISSRSRSTAAACRPAGGHRDLGVGLGSSDYPLWTLVGNHSGCESHAALDVMGPGQLQQGGRVDIKLVRRHQ
jgi:hypothetical protein